MLLCCVPFCYTMLSECVGSLAVTTVLLMIRVRICIVNAFQQASAVAVYTVVTVLCRYSVYSTWCQECGFTFYTGTSLFLTSGDFHEELLSFSLHTYVCTSNLLQSCMPAISYQAIAYLVALSFCTLLQCGIDFCICVADKIHCGQDMLRTYVLLQRLPAVKQDCTVPRVLLT